MFLCFVFSIDFLRARLFSYGSFIMPFVEEEKDTTIENRSKYIFLMIRSG